MHSLHLPALRLSITRHEVGVHGHSPRDEPRRQNRHRRAVTRRRDAARLPHEQDARRDVPRRHGHVRVQVDAAARGVLAAAGLAEFFVHRTGHGIGLSVHEEPYIVAGNDLPLTAGMAFSIEPGIYFPGRWGARVEDIVVVTEDGALAVNNRPHELVVVPVS